ncbi:MAG: ABC transporter ATP-binding protein [Methanomassiliicoccales archaeon]|nr:ABC transporter ATP-binding protein [Methanomassiliicoccales archaeon]
MSLLEVEGLSVSFPSSDGLVRANDGVSFTIAPGETFGIVGETGCGKTVLGRALLRLLPDSAMYTGRAAFRGKDILSMKEDELKELRGRGIAMVMQNPTLSLNPLMRVVDQVAEAYVLQGMDWKVARGEAGRKLYHVGIPRDRVRDYPHQFSGGMKQRVMIAIALALNPGLLIADEPTKGLDGEARENILRLLGSIRDHEGRGTMLITHDLRAAAGLCDRLAVMYAGELVEIGSTLDVIGEPRHPYTRALLGSRPESGFEDLPGEGPPLTALPRGCRFCPRCAWRQEDCVTGRPEMVEAEDRQVRCPVVMRP